MAADDTPGQDPALSKPAKTAKRRVAGRTSDAASRVEGTSVGETPADLDAAVKSSDAGPERYPFPPGGDVEVATVPDTAHKGEKHRPPTIEDQVTLLEHNLVPERLVGRRALVIAAPSDTELLSAADFAKATVTVRTRDELNALIVLPLAAVEVIRGLNTTVRG